MERKIQDEPPKTGRAPVIIRSYGLRSMSSGDGRSRLNFNSVCSASTKHSAQSSQIRSFKSVSLQHMTAISVQTGQKSAYSETRGSRAMASPVDHLLTIVNRTKGPQRRN